MLYASAGDGQVTGKSLTYKVHLCPASAKEQTFQQADSLLVVQNNNPGKPCVRMKTQINSIRCGDNVIVVTKVISEKEFL